MDYETLPNDYILTVTVRDGGTPSLSDEALIYIGVEDVNDNAPHITAPVGNTITLDIKEVSMKVLFIIWCNKIITGTVINDFTNI